MINIKKSKRFNSSNKIKNRKRFKTQKLTMIYERFKYINKLISRERFMNSNLNNIAIERFTHDN